MTKKRAVPGIAEICVYTIVHTDRLKAAYAAGGQGTFEEGRRWVAAKRLLAVARGAGRRVPVLFAAAEHTAHLIYFGWLEDVVLGAVGAGRATTFRVSGLKPFPKPHPKNCLLYTSPSPRD